MAQENSLVPRVSILLTIFFLHIFPGVTLFFGDIVFSFFHEVIRKIFKLILMITAWLMMISDFKLEARLS